MPLFTPPTVTRTFGGKESSLWGRINYEEGTTVLKTGASYRQVQNPSAEECNAADICYLGGHTYWVTDTEAAALNAAGYDTDEQRLDEMLSFTTGG